MVRLNPWKWPIKTGQQTKPGKNPCSNGIATQPDLRRSAPLGPVRPPQSDTRSEVAGLEISVAQMRDAQITGPAPGQVFD
jgi:hypothetical protein